MALYILAVGMTTIFAILGIVVLLGQTLIRLVNRFAPGELAASVISPSTSPASIPDQHIAAIHATVEIITAGKGSVTSIQSER